MTRRLPLCAFCGERLDRTTVRLEFRSGVLRGVHVAWHSDIDPPRDCYWKDPVRIAHDDERPLLVSAIEARGPGRVTRPVRRRTT